MPSRFCTASDPPEQNYRVRAMRRAAVLLEIEQHSSDPDLSAAAVAARLGITPRYVHLLLEETGRTFSNHLRARRLQRALTLLRDPRWHQCKIADIAGEAGFSDLSHFSRVFRRRYGATPSGIRAQAKSGGN